MDVTKYTFNFRYAGRLVSVIIEANSLEEAKFVLSGIKGINESNLTIKENG
jgi:hypothetical protein